MFRKIIIILIFTICNSCFARLNTFIAHINGINTTHKEANDNTTAISRVLGFEPLPPAPPVFYHFITLWNPTGDDAGETFWSNLSDLIKQKAGESQANMTLNDFTHYWIKANHLPNYPEDSTEYIELKSKIRDKYREQLEKNAGKNFQTILDEYRANVPIEFRSMVKFLHDIDHKHSDNKIKLAPNSHNEKLLLFANRSYDNNKFNTIVTNLIPKIKDTDVPEKDLVILLPHSQGNLYANALFNHLRDVEKQNNVFVYGIAPPADYTPGWVFIHSWINWVENKCPIYASIFFPVSGYITSSNDHVINGARVLFNQYPSQVILPENTTIPFSVDDVLGHNLIDIYLNNPAVVQELNRMIFDLSILWYNQIRYC